MSIERIMSNKVVCVGMDDTLETVREIFDNTQFHHLLVVSGDRLVGVISDRDLLQHLSPFIDTPSETRRDLSTLNKRAHHIMTRDLVTLGPSASIVDAIRLFNRHTLSCLPVVDDNKHIFGIVTWRDVLQYAEQLVEQKKPAE